MHGGSVGGGMEVYNGGVESTQSIGGSGWLNKTTERVFEFVAESDMAMLKFFSGEVTGVEANMYLSKVEISIVNSNHYSRIRGDKTYELSNHLGNVLATITDRKLGFSNIISHNFASHYQAEVTSATDYYPFGSPMSKRSVFDYKSKYGFNSAEKHNELDNLDGLDYDLGARFYSSKLGRMFSPDPRESEYPWQSTYAYFSNSPISQVDINGEGGGDSGQNSKPDEVNSNGKLTLGQDSYLGSNSVIPAQNVKNQQDAEQFRIFTQFVEKYKIEMLDTKGNSCFLYPDGSRIENDEPTFFQSWASYNNTVPSGFGEYLLHLGPRYVSSTIYSFMDNGYLTYQHFTTNSGEHLDGTPSSYYRGLASLPLTGLSLYGLGYGIKNLYHRSLSSAEMASSWQGKGYYTGVDNWKNINLNDGKLIVGGLPGQSNYYTTISGLNRSGFDAAKLFEGLQVMKHSEFGYRGYVGIYKVTGKTQAAFGTTYANKQFGSGGLPQIFIKDYSKLKLIEKIPLK